MTVSKYDTNYGQPAIEARALHTRGEGRLALILEANTEEVSDATKPELRTTGNTACYLTGKLKVTTTGIDQPLITFPDGYLPTNVGEHTCVREDSTGAKTVVPLKRTSTGLEAVGPTNPDEVYHFDGIVYFTRY